MVGATPAMTDHFKSDRSNPEIAMLQRDGFCSCSQLLWMTPGALE
jgi:hypothetical protein